MIRILHFADLHLGFENYGRIDPATGLSTCFGEFLAVFDELVEFALGNDIDLVLFCGDAYKSRDPSQTQQREFASRIARLAAAGIPVFLLVGNHDRPNAFGRATALDIFDTLSIANITVANHPYLYLIKTRRGPVQVAALPWVRRSALLAQEEARNLSAEAVNVRLAEALADALAGRIPDINPDLPAVLAAHVHSSNAEVGSEKRMMMGWDPILLHSALANPVFDYVALGHIHKAQLLSYSPPVAYSGSLQRIDFGDEKDVKGFYVMEIEHGRAHGEEAIPEFHPVKARRFVTIPVNISPSDLDPTAVVLRAVHQRRQETVGAIVRVEVKLPELSERLFQEAEVRKALSEAQWVDIPKDVQREGRTRLGGWSPEKQSPLEALRVYLKMRNTPPDRTKALLEHGEQLIRSLLEQDTFSDIPEEPV